jgi:hypothetical protein
MVMVGHSQRLAQPLTRHQRRATAIVVAVLAGPTLWAVLRPGSGAAGDGTLRHQCGAAARSWCQSEFTRPEPFALRAQVQWRLAGVSLRDALRRVPYLPVDGQPVEHVSGRLA